MINNSNELDKENSSLKNKISELETELKNVKNNSNKRMEKLEEKLKKTENDLNEEKLTSLRFKNDFLLEQNNSII